MTIQLGKLYRLRSGAVYFFPVMIDKHLESPIVGIRFTIYNNIIQDMSVDSYPITGILTASFSNTNDLVEEVTNDSAINQLVLFNFKNRRPYNFPRR